MSFGVAVWAGLLAASCLALPARAEPLSIRDAFKPPSIVAMKLSPDGRHIAATAQVKEATAIFLIDADTLLSKIVAGPATGLSAPLAAYWIAKDLLAVDHWGGTTIVTLDGKESNAIGGKYFGRVPSTEPGHEAVLLHRPGGYYIDRVEVRTGASRLANYDMPGHPIDWVFDDQGVPRVVTTMSTAFWTDDTTVTHWYRPSQKSAWEKLASFSVVKVPWVPAYLTHDGQSLVVYSSDGRDTRAYFRYDLNERRIAEMLAGHPTEDIGAVSRDEGEESYQLVVSEGMKPQLRWFDDRWAALQHAVDQLLPGRVNILSGSPRAKVLVASRADIDPGQWFVLDTQTMALKKIIAAKPEIDPQQMLPMTIVSYAAQDGMTIPAYLTLPRGKLRGLPVVVLIHGGPVARDHWRFDPEVQLLASRGYAVFQPQFRGSEGFGMRYREAGFGQWGLAMQDDITAGAKWLVDEGIADPQRICIYGTDYGGYAAMWALIKTPGVFRCGASLAGVADLNYMFRDDSYANDHPVSRLIRRTQIGDPKVNAQQFDEVSPLKKAASINAPVLIAHGDQDSRVPIEHSEKLVKALKKNGKNYQWIELEGEGHGIWQEKNQQRFYGALLDFLDRHIGAPRPQPAASSPP